MRCARGKTTEKNILKRSKDRLFKIEKHTQQMKWGFGECGGGNGQEQKTESDTL